MSEYDFTVCDLCGTEIPKNEADECAVCGSVLCDQCIGGFDDKNRTWCKDCFDDPSINDSDAEPAEPETPHE